jgi:hypothetical protein
MHDWLDPHLVASVVPADSMGELPPLARHFA